MIIYSRDFSYYAGYIIKIIKTFSIKYFFFLYEVYRFYFI